MYKKFVQVVIDVYSSMNEFTASLMPTAEMLSSLNLKIEYKQS